MDWETVFIGFGSNLGDRQELCDRAIALLGLLPHSHLTGVSSYYETEPIDPERKLGNQWFINGVVRIETSLTPENLLAILEETERGLGRRKEDGYVPRTMDCDMLFYGQRIINQKNLLIPHPRLHLRRFVLVPMVELAPDWQHPTLKQSVKELLANLSDSSQVRKMDVLPGSQYRPRPTCSSPPS